MLKIGIADLDTSHPGRWVPILQEWNTVEVVAVWDGGTVRPGGYAQTFAQEHNIPHNVDTIEEMVPLVDVVFIQSNNWDRHVPCARPFVEAGKGVYIDKPVAGRLSDLFQLQEWVKQGADIIGGSSLRCCEEVVSIREAMGDGQPVSVFATGPNEYFNYGIHTVEMVQGVIGGGAETVTWLPGHLADQLLISYGSGLQVMLELSSPSRAFSLTVTATTGQWHASIQSDFYRALLEDIVAHFSGARPFPADIDLLNEAVLIMLAGRESKRLGIPVLLDEVTLAQGGFDGDTFNEAYRISRIGR